MKKFKARVIFCLLIIFFLDFKTKQLITRIQTSDLYYIVCDQNLALNLKNKIKDFINENLKRKKPKEFFESLKAQFPVIDSVTIARKVPEILSVKVYSHKPKFIINKSSVYSDGKFFDVNSFSFYALNGIDNINTKEKISSEFKDFLNVLPQSIAQQFQITWINKNYIELKSKTDNCVLIIKHDFIPNDKHLKLCQVIKDQENNGNLVFDLRFSNQIVQMRNLGGG